MTPFRPKLRNELRKLLAVQLCKWAVRAWPSEPTVTSCRVFAALKNVAGAMGDDAGFRP